MDVVQLTEYCLAKPKAKETFPFGGDTLVFKVCGKVFALFGIDALPISINLKCDPEWAIELRESHFEITPGYHMNKKHWNTVNTEGGLTEALIKKMIDHSYDLVVHSLSKKERATLDQP